MPPAQEVIADIMARRQRRNAQSKQVRVSNPNHVTTSQSKEVSSLPFIIPEHAERKNSSSTYSIVAAVYNVSLYLDAFFKSIVNQTIDFEKYIEIILVDDGSTDDSAEIIAEWVKKYPFSIRYLKQNNAGQAQARNNGLRYAKNEWLTFVDPDDFLSLNYFEAIDKCLKQSLIEGRQLKMVSANMIFFMENRNTFSDTHALKFRFANGDHHLQSDNLGKYIQLSASTAVFKRVRVLSENLFFNPLIRPAFEDGHFVNRYLLGLDNDHIAFISEPVYYYRKRENGTSTIDTAWEKPGRFDAQLRLGYQSLINESLKRYGVVKPYIQRTIFYDLAWHFKRFINNEGKLSHLSEDARANYEKLLREIMQHISYETMLSFELAGLWFFQKFGLIAYYKNTEPRFNITYIDAADEFRDLVKVRYFTRSEHSKEVITFDTKTAIPVFDKTHRHTLFGDTFLFERILWLKPGDTQTLSIQVENKLDTRISLKGKQHKGTVGIADIYSNFRVKPIASETVAEEHIALRKQATDKKNQYRYANCWLFMDRNSFADDNAEHLYRYVQNNHSQHNIFFVLDESSSDWERLKSEGFKLIPFGTDEHKIALLNAAHLISSHADHYVFGGLPKAAFGDILKYKFTFLQHGVIKDDLSGWLNNKDIQCFVTTSKREYDSICHGDSYKFSEKEVVLTGLPRHDRLRATSRDARPSILIMPTWRHDLVGKASDDGFERIKQTGFIESQYATEWKSFLCSERLRQIAEKHELDVVFPHANVQPYLSEFEIPDYIKIGTHNPKISMQQYFANCEILVTDYSSVAFEVAALDRKVVYFQFDHETFFNGSHTYTKGYYTYELDGFGPVCKSLDDSLSALNEAAENSHDDHLYKQRRDDTFAFHDTLSCERVYKAIINLERNTLSHLDISKAARRAALRAMENCDWNLACEAWERLVGHTSTALKNSDALNYCRALRKLGEYEKCHKWLEQLKSTNLWSDDLENENIQVQFELHPDNIDISSYELYVKKFAGKTIHPKAVAAAAKHYRKVGDIEKAIAQLELSKDVEDSSLVGERAIIAETLNKWVDAENLWRELNKSSPSKEYCYRIANAQYRQEKNQEALQTLKGLSLPLSEYEENIIAGEIFYLNNKWKEANKCWSAASEMENLSPEYWLKLARCRRRCNQIELALLAIARSQGAMDERTFLQESALLSMASESWNDAVAHLREFIDRKDLNPNKDASVDLAYALVKTGNIEAGTSTLTQYCKKHGHSPRTEKVWNILKLSA